MNTLTIIGYEMDDHCATKVVDQPGTASNHRLDRAKAMRSAWESSEGSDVPRIADLLADLMHLCDAEGLDFESELSMATDFHGDEQASANACPFCRGAGAFPATGSDCPECLGGGELLG